MTAVGIRHIFIRVRNGEIKLICAPPVFFEVAWTLKAMTAIPNMTLLDEEIVICAISLAQETGQEFADAYIAAVVRTRKASLATFNKKHFAKLGARLYL